MEYITRWPAFNITYSIVEKLETISPAMIDRSNSHFHSMSSVWVKRDTENAAHATDVKSFIAALQGHLELAVNKEGNISDYT
ncbi:MAG: hypothetical protein LBH18_07005 [Spirochaetaceae bacterium]|jgi:hypothetical protein|nr:hypothetical protein [Spirochaetaceae bacterium]